MKSAVRRTDTYFQSPSGATVREPHTTTPTFETERIVFTPAAARDSASCSETCASTPVTPTSLAPTPAGACHTPRSTSVRAISPATAPLGAHDRGPPLTGSTTVTDGKYTAAFVLPVSRSRSATPVADRGSVLGGSATRKVRRRSQYASAAASTSSSAQPGRHRRFNASVESSAASGSGAWCWL